MLIGFSRNPHQTEEVPTTSGFPERNKSFTHSVSFLLLAHHKPSGASYLHLLADPVPRERLHMKPFSGNGLCVVSFTAFLLLTTGAAISQTTGAVYINTNQTNNEVWSYTRATDGTLTFAGSFSTQGSGSNASNLSSQGAVALNKNGKFLFVVNAGSNEITSFSVQPGGHLTFVSKIPSGGQFPNSLTTAGNFLYVLNAHGTAHINGFRISQTGALRAIAGSSRPLSTAAPNPAQVQFSPNGMLLVVTEIDTDKLDTYTDDSTTGLATGPDVQDSAGPGPFGFAFDNKGHLIVSEVELSSASSYTVSSSGTLTVVTGALDDFGVAACWVINTNNRSFPQQYSYITNTGDGTVSGFSIAVDGSIALLNADGKTLVLPS